MGRKREDEGWNLKQDENSIFKNIKLILFSFITVRFLLPIFSHFYFQIASPFRKVAKREKIPLEKMVETPIVIGFRVSFFFNDKSL